MKKSRFTEEQMVAIPREADRTSVAEAAHKNTVGEQTICVWRKHLGELAPVDVKRLRTLEAANSCSRKRWSLDAREPSDGFAMAAGSPAV
jgi:putative transposase